MNLTQKISQMTPKGADLAATDLIEVSTLEAGSYVTRSITGQELIDAIPLPPSGLTIGTTPISSGTIGRVLFEGTGNVLQQSAGLTWDNTNNIFNSIGSVKATGVVSTTRSIEMLYDESIGSMIRTTNYDLIHLLSGSNKLATFQSTGILFPASSSQLIGNNSRNLVEVYNEGTGKLTAKTTGAWNLELGTNDSIRATIFGSTGNIGINTTTDAGYKLDVNGTARVSGDVTSTGSFITNTKVGFSNNSRTINFNDANSGILYQGFGGHRFQSYNGSSYVEMFTIVGNQANLRIGINSTTPNASAVLDVVSTDKGFLPPRMTTTQRNAIASPAAGLIVYDTTLNLPHFFNGTIWVSL
jgi:hypothetical protein